MNFNALGLRPMIWTTGPGGPFDTNDWHVAGCDYTAVDQFATLQNNLRNAPLLVQYKGESESEPAT